MPRMSSSAVAVDAERIERLVELRRAVEGALEGKPDAVELALVALLARGHVLIEDVPGVGKTTLARAPRQGRRRRDAPRAVHQRPACRATSSACPSTTSARAEFVLRQGPIFSNMLLADEINRASPRTQSALLEAMNDGQVSIDGQTMPLPEPFLVIATQNPQDFAGTFPLPESQLDRFMVRIRIGYPPASVETRLMLEPESDRVEHVPTVLDPQSLVALQREVDRVTIDASLGTYLQALITATRTTPAARARRLHPRRHEPLARGARPRAAARPQLLHRRRHPRPRGSAPGPPRAARRPRGRLRPEPRGSRNRRARRRRARPRAALKAALCPRSDSPSSRVARSHWIGSPTPATRLGRLRRRLRPPRKLKITREGKYFIGITFGVGFAAINTGNNLLYLLLGMLLSLIVVSGVLSELEPAHA